jgi:glucose/arabinose dehydrogenase
MRITVLTVSFALLATGTLAQQPNGQAQAPRVIPRPPPQDPQATSAESAAPDGYAPIPQWAGQTRAPRAAKTAAFEVQTFASGLMGGYALHFLPDGRILLSERPGRMKIVGKDGTVSAPIGGLPQFGQGRSLFEVLPDRDFTKNRVIYLSYTAIPEGSNTPPRGPCSLSHSLPVRGWMATPPSSRNPNA